MLFNVVTYISEHYLTLINAALFYYNHHPPSNQPKNQSFRLNHGRTLKYRQLLGSRKKMGSIAPKLGPYRGIKISVKMSKIAISRNSRILTSFTKKALARSLLAQFTSFLLHMDTDRLF